MPVFENSLFDLCPFQPLPSQKKPLFLQAKRIVRLAEEACAGRLQALESVPADELGLVLQAVQRKRENDAKYLSMASKRRKLREMPTLPSILHKLREMTMRFCNV